MNQKTIALNNSLLHVDSRPPPTKIKSLVAALRVSSGNRQEAQRVSSGNGQEAPDDAKPWKRQRYVLTMPPDVADAPEMKECYLLVEAQLKRLKDLNTASDNNQGT
mmetsp:Transcript_28932/g.39388  ORF Transcript_28932/g.39388 Transcript_28932/m.39388 type:complete len:106 (-) Transcript_28932:70-387(-)